MPMFQEKSQIKVAHLRDRIFRGSMLTFNIILLSRHRSVSVSTHLWHDIRFCRSQKTTQITIWHIEKEGEHNTLLKANIDNGSDQTIRLFPGVSTLHRFIITTKRVKLDDLRRENVGRLNSERADRICDRHCHDLRFLSDVFTEWCCAHHWHVLTYSGSL